MQFAIAGLVALTPDMVQSRQHGQQQIQVLETLDVALADLVALLGHAARVSTWQSTNYHQAMRKSRAEQAWNVPFSDSIPIPILNDDDDNGNHEKLLLGSIVVLFG